MKRHNEHEKQIQPQAVCARRRRNRNSCSERGEANLYNLTSFLIVEQMRHGLAPKDAGIEGLKRIRANTVERRLLNSRGEPRFNIRFFVLNARGQHAGVTMYASGETQYAVCDDNGPRRVDFEALVSASPDD